MPCNRKRADGDHSRESLQVDSYRIGDLDKISFLQAVSLLAALSLRAPLQFLDRNDV